MGLAVANERVRGPSLAEFSLDLGVRWDQVLGLGAVEINQKIGPKWCPKWPKSAQMVPCVLDKWVQLSQMSESQARAWPEKLPFWIIFQVRWRRVVGLGFLIN